MHCFNHPEENAHGICNCCKKGICQNCMKDIDGYYCCDDAQCQQRTRDIHWMNTESKKILEQRIDICLISQQKRNSKRIYFFITLFFILAAYLSYDASWPLEFLISAVMGFFFFTASVFAFLDERKFKKLINQSQH